MIFFEKSTIFFSVIKVICCCQLHNIYQRLYAMDFEQLSWTKHGSFHINLRLQVSLIFLCLIEINVPLLVVILNWIEENVVEM